MKILYENKEYKVGKTFSEKGVITLPHKVFKNLLRLSEDNLGTVYYFKVKTRFKTFNASVTYRDAIQYNRRRFWVEFSCPELGNRYKQNSTVKLRFIEDDSIKYFDIDNYVEPLVPSIKILNIVQDKIYDNNTEIEQINISNVFDIPFENLEITVRIDNPSVASVSLNTQNQIIEIIKNRSGFANINLRCSQNNNFAEIDFKIYVIDEAQKSPDLEEKLPKKTEAVVNRIIRDTKIVRVLKTLYQNECQICGCRINTIPNGYSEGHHIIPLGGTHKGDDKAENIIILCPNHHTEFDYGVIRIDAEEWILIHNDKQNEWHNKKIKLMHEIDIKSIEYHNEKIYKE